MNDGEISDLGYLFYPTPQPPLSAHSGLAVNICDHPTEEHYDPEHVTLSVVDRIGTIERTNITYTWHGKRRLRLAPGRVVIADRKGKRIEAFTAGGVADLTTGTGRLCCRISSPVPIYRLADERGAGPECVAAMATDKIEALLAIYQAKWGMDQAGYAHRLTSIDTVTLYHAALASLLRSLDQTPNRQRGTRFHEVQRCVKAAIHVERQAGRGAVTESYLETLLRAPNWENCRPINLKT